jgi:alpha-glucosidase
MAGSPWWREGVLYEIYPRSFQDTDGDGVGDLRGIIERLEHLEWLGVDGIWLNPTFPSPNRDWGYDVSDFYGVHPELGTMEDLDELIARAGERGIRILLDLVPNHTSDQHPWFEERPELYVWSDRPNNWRMAWGLGSAWSYHEGRGQYYLHNFLPGQPDLDWWNPEVREEFDRILRFWFDRGVAGFRIDVAHGIVKDRELRDDPAVTPDDHPVVHRHGLRQRFSMNRPEVHDVLRSWRTITDEYDDRVLVGETFVLDLDTFLPFYGNGSDELHMAFNFLFVHEEFDAEKLRRQVEEIEERLPRDAWPVWTGSNHDVGRLATRWAGGVEGRARTALMMLLTMRGTPFLYAGDEIALPNVAVPDERVLDPGGRDPCRTPMHWEPGDGAGFTEPGVEPWLPLGDAAAHNVADQRADPHSTLHLVRDLIAMRRREDDLRSGAYASLKTAPGVWAFRRGDGFVVALNLGDSAAVVDDLDGTVAIGTDRGRDGEPVDGSLRLAAGEGALLRV